MTIVNIAAYLFVPIADPETLVQQLRVDCQELALKGTILVAPEGINLFLAAGAEVIDEFLRRLRSDARFSSITEKRQYSEHQPFLRMKVKLKREIVPLGVHNIDPNQYPAPRMQAEELKQWLDEGRDFVLLDTRNRFEFEQGAFTNSVDLNIQNFRSFPDVIKEKLAQWQDRPIVTFCTGGIRCEKAAPLMQQLGFKQVYQLDGGILKYFERCGGAHYRGDCFVFDERIGVDEQLTPTISARSTS